MSDEDRRVGAAFQAYSAANVFEVAPTGADVEFSLVAFDMLILEVKLDMTSSGGLRGDAVVLNVIGLKAQVAIVDVDITIGQIEVAFLGLGAAGRDLGDIAGSRRNADLLGKGRDGGEQNQPRHERSTQGGVEKKCNHAAN